MKSHILLCKNRGASKIVIKSYKNKLVYCFDLFSNCSLHEVENGTFHFFNSSAFIPNKLPSVYFLCLFC